MTIKEVEALTGIPKPNIRFYEKEGLLAPLRSSNNYRTYGDEEVERLRRIRILRLMGFTVAQIRLMAEQPGQTQTLMEARAGEIKREMAELDAVYRLCLEARESGPDFHALDPELLEMKLEWKRKGRDIMKSDKIDWLCRIRDLAFLFCYLCILSLIAFPINGLLGITLPVRALNLWRAVIALSPFPALILWAVTAGRARWGVPDLNRILVDSGKPRAKRERNRGQLYARVSMLHQAALTSLLVLPLNRALGITLPLWAVIPWLAVIFGLTIAVLVLKNRE